VDFYSSISLPGSGYRIRIHPDDLNPDPQHWGGGGGMDKILTRYFRGSRMDKTLFSGCPASQCSPASPCSRYSRYFRYGRCSRPSQYFRYGRCSRYFRYGRCSRYFRYGRCSRYFRYGRCSRPSRYFRFGFITAGI